MITVNRFRSFGGRIDTWDNIVSASLQSPGHAISKCDGTLEEDNTESSTEGEKNRRKM